SLVTSMTTANGATWAIVAMGGSAAGANQFWELFARAAASDRWELVTPPGVASNGGLVAAGGPATLSVAFRPSQGLTFSPLAVTSDAGKTWRTGLIDAPVASDPDALAAGAGAMLALLGDGTVEQGGTSGGSWTRLAAPGAIASSAAGRQCHVTSLTAVAYAPSGTPLAAASCARPGITGIFARSGTAWQAVGPVLAARQVTVLRLTTIAAGDLALLQARAGSGATLLAAWTSDGTRWTISAPLAVGIGQVAASGTGSGGAAWVLLADGRAYEVSGPGSAWRRLPSPPSGTAALAAGPGDAYEALAVASGKLTVYRLSPAGAWGKLQTLSVPIQYGSSS
ncbi:MAG: hypothetical protein WA805_13810, partial [Trebonia sp.]|uniref:hypothetical protein n=1 Tax=Trebonia sp. TaxID=2767075 RepID=UPI003C9F49C4